MTDQTGSERSTQTRTWVRRYPPLVGFIVALLIMIIIMPSALNLPQSNPTTVLEYAPIPPEKHDNPPPQTGSLSALGLGTSSTLTDENGGLSKVKVPKLGQGDNPIVKRCVGDPPRQTEDVNAPPCVAFFQGNNGGSTFRGVTKDEVKVVVYNDSYQYFGGDTGYESSPSSGSICDLDSKPDDPANTNCSNGEGTHDFADVYIGRALSRYFNDRFQTYNRHIHMYMYFSVTPATPTSRRSEAQDIFERIGPFAAIDTTTNLGGYAGDFITAAVKRQLNVYGSYTMSPNSFFKDNAPYLWSFWPDIEHIVTMYKDYFCKRIAPFKVTHSGNSGDQGKPRKYGFFYTTDPLFPTLTKFAKLEKAEIMKGCPNGGPAPQFSPNDYTYSRNGYTTDTNPTAPSEAQQNVQKMQLDGVTTVLWLGGYEAATSAAADDANWRPEWVVAGDLQNDQVEEGAFQNSRVWSHARIMTPALRDDKQADSACHQAFREGDPYGGSSNELKACGWYRSFFMLFRGIQVAGPFLTPDAVDQGNHSIAAVQSTNPYVASCYFDPGDYTCVKDAQEEFWDPAPPNPNGDSTVPNGCWRETDGGKRFVSGSWTEEDNAFKIGADTPCNQTSDNSGSINPYGPAG